MQRKRRRSRRRCWRWQLGSGGIEGFFGISAGYPQVAATPSCCWASGGQSANAGFLADDGEDLEGVGDEAGGAGCTREAIGVRDQLVDCRDPRVTPKLAGRRTRDRRQVVRNTTFLGEKPSGSQITITRSVKRDTRNITDTQAPKEWGHAFAGETERGEGRQRETPGRAEGCITTPPCPNRSTASVWTLEKQPLQATRERNNAGAEERIVGKPSTRSVRRDTERTPRKKETPKDDCKGG